MKFQLCNKQGILNLTMHRIVIQNLSLLREASFSFRAASLIKPVQLHQNINLYDSRLDSRRQFHLSLATERFQHSYFHCPSSVPLVGHTIGSALEATTEKYPDRECLVFCDTGIRRNFAQLFEEVDQLAAGFLKLGFKKGDRVGIWGPSSIEWVLTQFATARLGIILVTINPAYQQAEVEYALHKVGCKALVSAAKFKTQDYYKMIREIAPEIENDVPGDLKSKRLPDLTDVIIMGEEQYPGAHKFDDVIKMGGSSDVSRVRDLHKQLQFDDCINIQFTSGTTGYPKGATLSHHNIMNNTFLIGRRVGFHEEYDRILCQVPLYHCYGMVAGLLSSTAYGVANVFPTAGYDPIASLDALKKEECTIIYGTPTMYIDILGLAEKANCKFPKLKKGVMAGSPCPIEVISKVEKVFGVTIQIAYGSTETSPVVNLMFRDDSEEKRTTTVGKALDHTEHKIVNSNGDIVPIGEPGELLTRGYCVMQKYWGDEEKTKKAIDEHGWYHSGDIAIMDEDGYIKLVGRIKDMIIRGGENVYPTEIEDFLHTHPKIDDIQVFGVPDPRFGEEIAAWIQLKAGESATVEEIKHFCKGRISHFKIPKHIKFVTEYPITITRKVQKFKMIEDFSKELGLN